MRDIQRADITGARIVSLHETYELLQGGLDCRQIYFTVDRGFTFLLPYAGRRWAPTEVPSSGKRLPCDQALAAILKRFRGPRPHREPTSTSEIVWLIKQRRIAGVYCAPFDKELGFHYPDDGTIVFDDGSQLSNTVVAPHGTGAARLYFFLSGSVRCTPEAQLVDYFTIPLENEND